MIQDKEFLQIPEGIEYINEWTDEYGNFMLDYYIPKERILVDKKVTGCGFTTWCLCNNENTIVVSPRLRLIHEKQKKHYSFYFNREINPRTKKQIFSIQDLENSFTVYCQDCSIRKIPLKIFVSYDSFIHLADMLERFGFNISNDFRIAVDESHTLIKDVKLKQYNNKCVLSEFLKRLFVYKNLLFISATPVVQYLQNIPEFKVYPVRYIELQWSNAFEITQIPHSCSSPINAFDKIYADYKKNKDSVGNNYFDVIYGGCGQAVFSYQACIFLNSVQDIKKILNKYINRLGEIKVEDITVICSATNPDNEKILQKIDSRLSVCKDVPGENEHHTTWSFITRTSFEGVDFYSPNASTFVIANYNVDALSLDISSDIPQIIGRQRRKDNYFRNTIHIYHTDNKQGITDMEYEMRKQRVLDYSKQQIAIWGSAPDNCKDTALNNIATIIDCNPNDVYLKTTNGVPEIDELLSISDDYCRDIIRNHQSWFISTPSNACNLPYHPMVQALKNELDSIFTQTTTQDRLKRIYDYFVSYPELQQYFFMMLHNEGYNSLAYYFNSLPLDRIYATGCNTWKLDKEIEKRKKSSILNTMIASRFIRGNIYSKQETKMMLQDIYDELTIKKTAKSTEIKCYADVEEAKKMVLKGTRFYKFYPSFLILIVKENNFITN